MRIRVEVDLGPPAGRQTLLLTAPAGTPLGRVLPAFSYALRIPEADLPALYVEGIRLTAETPLGWPPLLDGALLSSTGSPHPLSVARQAPVMLHIVGGPDSGHVHHLDVGEHTVGRTTQCAVTIADTSLSRVHAVIEVSADRIWVRDLGSTNGSLVGDRRIDSNGAELTIGETVRFAGSAACLRTTPTPSRERRPLGDGTVIVDRSPRHRPISPDRTVRLPLPPTPRSRPHLSMLVVILPLVFSIGIAVVLHNPLLAAMGLMSPLLTGSQYLGERRLNRRSDAAALVDHRAALRHSAEGLADAVAAERNELARLLPDPGHVATVAVLGGRRLWERRVGDPDLLRLRLGTGRRPSAVTVVDPDGSSWNPEHDLAPLEVDLTESAVGVCSREREQLLGLARSLLAQVITWHSHADVVVQILTQSTSAQTDWSWLHWAPHLRPEQQPPEQLLDLLSRRHPEPAGQPWAGPRMLVVVDGAREFRNDPDFQRLVAEGPLAGIHVLALDADDEALPQGCGTVITVYPNSAAVTTTDGVRRVCQPELLNPTGAARVARALAPLRDPLAARSVDEVPEYVRLVDLLDLDSHAPSRGPDSSTSSGAVDLSVGTPQSESHPPATAATQWADRIVARWLVHDRGLRATVGLTQAGPMVLDLARSGPHALVAGTTGAGKSELLRTLIASLATSYPPDAVCFVLVDYKGGAAFADCAQLPHTVGLVTDLDEALARRALVALEAELRRREELLLDAGVSHIDDLPAETPPRLARMIVIIDEFRALSDDLPDFVTGVVRMAALGRSLGLHLVLATQRPAGVVSADIRANVNVRIALRVRDRPDSYDVIEADDAAHIPLRQAGRALLRIGNEPLIVAQTAWASAPYTPPTPDVTATLVGEAGLAPATRTELPADLPPPVAVTDLQILTESARLAAAGRGITPPPPPWLAPLPAVVDLWPCWRDHAAASIPSGEVRPPCPGGSRLGPIPYAVRDEPELQAQSWLTWDPSSSGHLALAGGNGTGRTALLRTLAAGCAWFGCPGQVRLYLLDAGSGLRALRSLPHVAAYAHLTDLPLMARLISKIVEDLGATAGETAQPTTEAIVFIDGWEQVWSALEGHDHGRPAEALLTILRHGGSAGARVILAGGRGVLLPPAGSLVSTRLLLRMPDPLDMALAGISDARQPPPGSPGRARCAETGHEVQLGLIDPDPSAQKQDTVLDIISEATRQRHPTCPAPGRRIRSLPTAVHLDELIFEPISDGPTAPTSGPGSITLAIGVAADGHSTANIALRSGFLIAGAEGNGRTTTLLTLAHGLRRLGQPAVLLTNTELMPKSPPEHLAMLDHTDINGLQRMVAQSANLVILCDDVEGIVETPLEDVLTAHVTHARVHGGRVIAAGLPRELEVGYRGIVGTLRRLGNGLILGPTPRDEAIFGTSLPVSEPRLPGRAVLVGPLGADVVQVALPPRVVRPQTDACV